MGNKAFVIKNKPFFTKFFRRVLGILLTFEAQLLHFNCAKLLRILGTREKAETKACAEILRIPPFSPFVFS
jgi:hypothetical protein